MVTKYSFIRFSKVLTLGGLGDFLLLAFLGATPSPAQAESVEAKTEYATLGVSSEDGPQESHHEATRRVKKWKSGKRGHFLGADVRHMPMRFVKTVKLIPEGALVTKVLPGSPAEKVGLRIGDLIEKIADLDATADNFLAIHEKIATAPKGAKLTLVFSRIHLESTQAEITKEADTAKLTASVSLTPAPGTRG